MMGYQGPPVTPTSPYWLSRLSRCTAPDSLSPPLGGGVTQANKKKAQKKQHFQNCSWVPVSILFKFIFVQKRKKGGAKFNCKHEVKKRTPKTPHYYFLLFGFEKMFLATFLFQFLNLIFPENPLSLCLSWVTYELSWVELDCIGLNWAELDWVGLDWGVEFCISKFEFWSLNFELVLWILNVEFWFLMLNLSFEFKLWH